MEEKIIIIDFGSQYTQLIGRKIRELNVYSEIVPFNGEVDITEDVKGVIFSGSPYSVLDASSPRIELQKYFDNIPVLGICYGAQLIAHETGGNVMPSRIREYGRANLAKVEKDSLLSEISLGSQVWMSHADTIADVNAQFEIMASTSTVEVAAFQNPDRKIYGLQFHPEVYHSTDGNLVLKKFLVDICGCSQSWTPMSFVDEKVAELKELLGNEKVVLGLSGGVDSTVAAVLLHKAIGDNLHCIFVDNGLLRKNEFDQVLQQYEALQLNVKGVRAGDIFLDKLSGISDPEQKRKHIGNTFIEVFDDEAHRIQDVNWLGQGTIYPDVIESVTGTGGPSVTIKSHHNVGGLPDFMKLKVVEPLRLLFKDEVRRVGKALNIPAAILGRHPFPGPGLAIRILGDITAEKVRLLQEVDDIYISILKDEGLYDEVWQAGAILLPVQSVGVMGDERTYEQVVALRAVSSTDGMTADWSHLPHEVLSKISNDIINKVKGVNRVVYDISSKPPSTIEWE